MSTWRERAPEIQALLDKGATNAEIALHYGVSKKSIRNRLGELSVAGLIKMPLERERSVAVVSVKPTPEMPVNAKESIELNRDGTYDSEKPLWMTLEQVKDEEFLLKAHGFEPDKWILEKTKHKVWNGYSKQDGIVTLYSSSITVKPKQHGWTFEELVEVIKENVSPVHVESRLMRLHEERMLEIPIFDAHFGVSSFEDYRQTQSKICDLLASRHWAETFFVVAQDLLHNDNFRGQTANGTQIEIVDIPTAWRDATLFYDALITTAIRQSNRVFVMYSKANHDESLSWAFVQFLKARYPQVEFDDAVQERKAHTFGSVFIGVTHGDKARKQLHNIFPVEFPHEWSRATVRELHCGHLHVEDAKDVFGMMIRTLATRNKTDAWHRDNGYVGAHKRFQLFEYSTDALESIHYV